MDKADLVNCGLAHNPIYGHYDCKLTFWLPLMDYNLMGTYLWANTMLSRGDFHH